MAEINNNKLDPIEGKYKLEKSENFDQFLDRLGVGFLTKTAARTLKPTFVVKADEDNQFTFGMVSTFKNAEIKFKPGEEFEEDRLDGKRVKTVIERENENKFVQIQKDGKQQVEIIREFKGDEVHVWATCDGTTSFRLYRRIPE